MRRRFLRRSAGWCEGAPVRRGRMQRKLGRRPPSLQVAQRRDELDPEPTDWVQDRFVAGEDDDVGLRSTPTGVEPFVSSFCWKEKDAHGEELRLAYPSLRRLDRRELAVRRFVALANAPADAVDLAAEELARLAVERDRHVLARLHIAELVFPHVRRDPPRAAFEEA